MWRDFRNLSENCPSFPYPGQNFACLVLGTQVRKNTRLGREFKNEGGNDMSRSLKNLVLVVMFIMLSTAGAWAYESQLQLGATPVQEDTVIQPSYWFPASLRLFTPEGRPLGSWDSTKGVAPIVYQGLQAEITFTPVGFNTLLGVDMGMPGPNSDGQVFDGKPSELAEQLWRPMEMTSFGGFRWLKVVDCPWGPNVILFRVRHKDAKGVIKFLFFKFTFMKEGSVQQAFILNVQQAPDGWRDFSDAEALLCVRGFIPANASASDPELAAKLRAQRERKMAQQVAQVQQPQAQQYVASQMMEPLGSASIQLADLYERRISGNVEVKIASCGKVYSGIYFVPADRPLIISNLKDKSTVTVHPIKSNYRLTKQLNAPCELEFNIKLKEGN